MREVDFLLKFFFVLKFFFQSFVVNSSQMMENSSFNLRTKKLYFLLSKILSLFSSFNLLSIWEARNFIFFFQSSFNLRSWNLYFLLLIFFQFEKLVSTLNHKSFWNLTIEGLIWKSNLLPFMYSLTWLKS